MNRDGAVQQETGDSEKAGEGSGGRSNVAQIYVRSEDETSEIEEQTPADSTDSNHNSLSKRFSIPKELEDAMNEHKDEEMTEVSSEFNYESVSHYYMAQLAKDICSCSKVPSLLLEIIASALSITNIVMAFIAFYDISYETTNVRYREYAKNDLVRFHGGELTAENIQNLHIYKEAVFVNWRNFVHLGLSLIVLEFLAPALRIAVVTNRTPKKINTLHSLVQISLLTALVLEDGAVSLCKNMLFTEECGIRRAMMSQTSQISAALSLVNSIVKSVLFIWRSSYRNQRQVRDEMEAYTEIIILEEYQWYHCIIPILAHFSVVIITIWSLVNATNEKLICM
ncbi:uncharacterized protein [Watersipora subatra]|uniref:uncharacterized protein n=1 Tax=Watersipora subatra TaxID=2589382 RepID=UPI00355B0890